MFSSIRFCSKVDNGTREDLVDIWDNNDVTVSILVFPYFGRVEFGVNLMTRSFGRFSQKDFTDNEAVTSLGVGQAKEGILGEVNAKPVGLALLAPLFKVKVVLEDGVDVSLVGSVKTQDLGGGN